MTRDLEYAHRNAYDTRAHHLLCEAVRDMAEYVARGYDCFLCNVQYTGMQFTVYYLAYKMNRPTRKERGCEIPM